MKKGITFHIVSLFPEVLEIWLKTSIIGRAKKQGLFEARLYPLRDFAPDKNRTVDDFAYGGGGGMVLKVEPLVNAMESIRRELKEEPSLSIHFSPVGKPLNYGLISELEMRTQNISHLILICGHYEGVDQRFIDHWIDLEISLGDFVVTGGEIPALALVDTLIRQIDGVIENTKRENESYSLVLKENRLLEYPHYTRPSQFRDLSVPEILLSGDHAAINTWRQDAALQRTKERRPDLLE